MPSTISTTTTTASTTTLPAEFAVTPSKDVSPPSEIGLPGRSLDMVDRLKRSLESSDLDEVKNDIDATSDHKGRAIPGLPDPATIKKIVDLVTSIGEQVLPLVVSGNVISSTSQQIIDRWIQNNQILRQVRNELQLVPAHLDVPSLC